MNKGLKRRGFLNFGAGAIVASAFPIVANAQNVLNEVLNAISANKNSNIIGLPNGVSNIDANNGLKEALLMGAVAAITKTGKPDGYWGDNLIRIPLPSGLNSLQKNLKPLGLSKPFDDLQLKLNRAAELAAPKAKDIFVDAIKNLTITDIAGILNGGENAGTNFLKSKTKPKLVQLFRPNMEIAIDTSGAGSALNKINNSYSKQLTKLGGLGANGGNTSSSLKTQFIDYSVSKALDGLYFYVGKEEAAIRQNPAKRTSDLLKKVFGN